MNAFFATGNSVDSLSWCIGEIVAAIAVSVDRRSISAQDR
jgi:hypothetical protein